MLFAFLFMAVAQVPDPADLNGLLTHDSYPPAALAAGEQGTVKLEVEVAPGGKPRHCRIAQSSGSSVLDRETCALVMMRGNFVHSARNHPGRAFTLVFPVKWVLEDNVPVPFDASVARMVFAIANGRSGDCREERVSGPMRISNPCDAYRPLADPQLALLAERAGIAPDTEWVFEVGLIVGDTAGSAPGEGPGQFLLSRESKRLTIADDGSVIDCEASAVGWKPDPRECVLIRQNQRFAPRAAAAAAPLRKATQYSVSYLRPAERR